MRNRITNALLAAAISMAVLCSGCGGSPGDTLAAADPPTTRAAYATTVAAVDMDMDMEMGYAEGMADGAMAPEGGSLADAPVAEWGGSLAEEFAAESGESLAKASGADADVPLAAAPAADPMSAIAESGEEPQEQQWPKPRPGQLTAGEWNDNENYGFLLNLIKANREWGAFENRWLIYASDRITAVVSDGVAPVNNALVELLDHDGNAVFSARTDNSGVAYLFSGFQLGSEGSAAYIRANGAQGETRELDPATKNYEFSLPRHDTPQSLDLMFVIDTTGSMGDELEYLKTELDDVVRQVRRDNADIGVRLSVNVYRDHGDEYVVRPMPFGEDIESQLEFLGKQSANGGGDYEEAVPEALADALEQHGWNDGATAKLLFLVLDAPPHNTDGIIGEMHRLLSLASKMGVRIIPVASSGIDKDTEFLLRAMSMATGGTYVFLTDDSGIGGSHVEPTIGYYDVELLNELLVRVINRYAKNEGVTPWVADRQAIDGQGNDGQGNDGQGNDGQGNDGQGNDGQTDDGQGNDGQGNDGQGNDGQGNDGQTDDGQGNDGQADDGQADDGQTDDGQGNDGQADDNQDP